MVLLDVDGAAAMEEAAAAAEEEGVVVATAAEAAEVTAAAARKAAIVAAASGLVSEAMKAAVAAAVAAVAAQTAVAEEAGMTSGGGNEEADAAATAAAAEAAEGSVPATPSHTVTLPPGGVQRPAVWSAPIWDLWTPGFSAHPADLPPVAVAAMADAVAAAGQTPAVVVSDLRSELVEKLEEGGELWTNARADDGGAAERSAAAFADEAASISRLAAELCLGPPRDLCVKCRRAPRSHALDACCHEVLCEACSRTVRVRVGGHEGRGAALSRLVCPFCRGFELAAATTADDVFELVDASRSGTISTEALSRHLLVSGHGVGEIADLFDQINEKGNGAIDREEWADGFERLVVPFCAAAEAKRHEAARVGADALEEASRRVGWALSSMEVPRHSFCDQENDGAAASAA